MLQKLRSEVAASLEQPRPARGADCEWSESYVVAARGMCWSEERGKARNRKSTVTLGEKNMLAPLSWAALHHYWGKYQPWSNAGVFPTSAAVAPHNTATAATTLQVMRCLIPALVLHVGNSPVGTGQPSIKENNLQLTTFQWEDGEAAHIGATVSF